MSLFSDSSDWFDSLKAKFKEMVLVSRKSKYESLYKNIEEYVNRKQNVILNDYNRIIDSESPVMLYEVYTNEADVVSRELTDDIYRNVGKYVIMNTHEYKLEYSISYDGLTVVKIYGIREYKNIGIFTLINPIVKKGYWSDLNLRYFPPELDLIEIYRKLYSPEFYGDWDNLVVAEKNMFEELMVRNKEGLIVGGVVCNKRQMSELENMKLLTVTKFLIGRDIVLIGPWAVLEISSGVLGKSLVEVTQMTGEIHGEDCNKCIEKVQVIIDCSIDVFVAEYTKFIGKYSKTIVKYKEQPLHIMFDFRLTKYTIYLTFDDPCGIVEKPIMDVFTCAEYSLISYVSSQRFLVKKGDGSYSKNLKIGTLYVILRFMMLDIWLLKIVQRLDLLSKEMLETKINMIIGYMKYLRKLRVVSNKAFSEHYLGVYESESRAKKKNALVVYETNRKKTYPYIPLLKYK